jgi:predicted aspartyl protease
LVLQVTGNDKVCGTFGGYEATKANSSHQTNGDESWEVGCRFLADRRNIIPGLLLLAVSLISVVCSVHPPEWASVLAYRPDEIFPARLGRLGMPYIEVTVGETTDRLLFDTGNMVGLTLAKHVIDQLELPVIGSWNRLDSDGRIIGTYRRVRATEVRLLGRTLIDQTIFESSDDQIDGLVGPDDLTGMRFTLDYRAQILAVASSKLDTVPEGYIVVPLVHSSLHPRLILAIGRVSGKPVLFEYDTGASRSNIDPSLARDLSLPAVRNGVRIDSLQIGSIIFSIPSVKVNPKSGIDSTLASPIQFSVGSDILSQIIWTVDYDNGRMLLRDARW